jgi:alpha-D-ribose 1-methylphosphonate 5-triphosphate synthase subunit PhnL
MAVLTLTEVAKTFTMHLQDSVCRAIVTGVSFAVEAGECVVLAGPSGTGKSSILKMIFGNYRCDAGAVIVSTADATVDVARAGPQRVLALRRETISYVSQFLRAVPRVPALDVVTEPLVLAGLSREIARVRAAEMLARLQMPPPLWRLPPAIFSGGEQQRLNIARGFLPERPILLLDEPTASLDADNRNIVVDLIAEKKRCGTAILAIVHDDDVRARIADRVVDATAFAAGYDVRGLADTRLSTSGSSHPPR